MAARLDRQLCYAAERGDARHVTGLIAIGADPDAFAGKGNYTPLQHAATRGHLAVLAALLKAGAHVDGTSYRRTTALMGASLLGLTAIVQALIAAGAKVNRVDEDADTALHMACFYGKHDVARVLLAAGADTNARNLLHKRPIDVVRKMLRLWASAVALSASCAKPRRCVNGVAVPTQPRCVPCCASGILGAAVAQPLWHAGWARWGVNMAWCHALADSSGVRRE